MNTVKQEVEQYLESLGMFNSQSTKVLEKMASSMPEMNGRWNEPVDAYPPPMIAVLKMSAKRYGLEWIEANLPMAWYKPMFQ